MDKSIRVQVKEPCHENWQNMTENEKGRFCASCQKTVVDFTLMSDNQILNHLSKATGSTCGKFANDQLDRELKAQVVKPKSKWAYFINLLIPIFFSSSGSNCTKGEPKVTSNVDNQTDSRRNNSGIVGQLSVTTYCPAPLIIPDVDTTIEVLGELELVPEVLGKLELVPVDTIKEEEVNIDTAVKFIPPVITSDPTRLMGDTVLFSGDPKTPLPLSCLKGSVGGLIIRPTVIEEPNAIKQFAKDTLAKLGIKRPIKAYPNPVIAGQSITIDYSPKILGTYNIDLFDINGRMIYSRQVNMVFEKQSFQVPTISSWSKGTYIIRISGEGKDNVQNVKVLVR